MPGGVLHGIKRFILWDYPRASWQYDLMVGFILVFLFLTPRDWFRDQPRIPSANRIALLPAAPGNSVFWMDAELLTSVPEAEQAPKAGAMLKTYTGANHPVVRLEAILDSENEIKGYLIFTKP